MKNLDGRSDHVDRFYWRELPGTNAMRLIFAETNENGDETFRSGVIISLTNARHLANMLNDALNSVQVGPVLQLPEAVGGVDLLTSPDGATTVELPKANGTKRSKRSRTMSGREPPPA